MSCIHCQPMLSRIAQDTCLGDLAKMAKDTLPLAHDLLKGVPAIAQFLGWQPHQTYYALQKGLVPGFKNGKAWFSRKSKIVEAIEANEAGSLQVDKPEAA